jgi:hypothetical protein
VDFSWRNHFFSSAGQLTIAVSGGDACTCLSARKCRPSGLISKVDSPVSRAGNGNSSCGALGSTESVFIFRLTSISLLSSVTAPRASVTNSILAVSVSKVVSDCGKQLTNGQRQFEGKFLAPRLSARRAGIG